MRPPDQLKPERSHLGFVLLSLVVCASLVRGEHGQTPSPEPARQQPTPVKPTPKPAEPRGPQTESIRIDTDLVTVVTSVAGPAGAVGGTLRREDFEVLEDGVSQEIVNFARDPDVPLRLVLLFDTSASVSQRIGFERRAAARFFEQVMRPQDQAALFAFSTDVTVLQDFTSRVPLLANATKQLRAYGATSLYDAIFLAADNLKHAPGRHVIVIVSDGGDTTSVKDLKQALSQAQQADAVIFAIFSGSPSPSESIRDLAAERALAALTGETGGEVYFPQPKLGGQAELADEQSLNYLDAAFTKLADQLRTQYTIGFYSTNEARDGRFRRLVVRIKRPGYVARARAGYYAPKG